MFGYYTLVDSNGQIIYYKTFTLRSRKLAVKHNNTSHRSDSQLYMKNDRTNNMRHVKLRRKKYAGNAIPKLYNNQPIYKNNDHPVYIYTYTEDEKRPTGKLVI